MKKRMIRGLGVVALVVVTLLALAACGSSGPSQADYDSLQERVAGLEKRLTDKEQELDELKATLTATNQSGGNSNTTVPDDNGPAGKGDSVLITFEQYKEIEIGMTYKEVTEIIGGDGKAISEADDMVVYSYFGSGDTGANAILSFHKGKLMNKAQSGLN